MPKEPKTQLEAFQLVNRITSQIVRNHSQEIITLETKISDTAFSVSLFYLPSLKAAPLLAWRSGNIGLLHIQVAFRSHYNYEDYIYASIDILHTLDEKTYSKQVTSQKITALDNLENEVDVFLIRLKNIRYDPESIL